MAFTSDGHTLALAFSRYQVKLVETRTGRASATLETPPLEEAAELAFSPDDTRLAVASGKEGVRVWDLRRIREQLAELGLDWNAPPLPPNSARSRTPPVLPLKVLQQ